MMTRILVSAAAGGLAGGLLFGALMQIMRVPAPGGGEMPMTQMVAMLVGSNQIAAGWTFHLINSAVIGALFGWILGERIFGLGSGLFWGAVYGAAWWILGTLVLMPLILGMPAPLPLAMAQWRPVVVGSLIGHLAYGLVLGSVFVGLQRKAAIPLRRNNLKTGTI